MSLGEWKDSLRVGLIWVIVQISEGILKSHRSSLENHELSSRFQKEIYFTMVSKDHYLEIKPFTNADVPDKEQFKSL